jgi:hypothetical protein
LAIGDGNGLPVALVGDPVRASEALSPTVRPLRHCHVARAEGPALIAPVGGDGA